MKQKLFKKSKVFLVLVISAFLFVTGIISTIPVKAANVGTEAYRATFTKKLILETGVKVPPVTFSFNIENGTVPEDNKEIISGISPENITIEKVVFTPTDESVMIGDEVSVSKDIYIDFPKNQFTAPGIYRYIIKETESTFDGITYDKEELTLDVYVGYEDGSETELVIMGCELYRNGTSLSDKTQGFVNTYTTSNLTVIKNVTGNQGDRDKYFDFEIDIANATPKTVYVVETLNNGDNHGNDTILTVDDTGSASGTFKLRDNGSVIIKGLTSKTKYKISEIIDPEEKYKTSYQIGSGENFNSSVTSDNVSIGSNDVEITFTNHKEGSVPTGIINEFGPFVLLGVVVLGGFVLLIGSRKRRSY